MMNTHIDSLNTLLLLKFYRKEHLVNFDLDYLIDRGLISINQLLELTNKGKGMNKLQEIDDVKKNDTDFDPNKDFVALGFKPKDSDNIYIGASAFIPDEVCREITADGILVVLDTNIEYNLVNLSKHSIYLKTPDLITDLS